MTLTDLDPATLARSLRLMSGDGSIEWVMEPIQADVLHDVADMLVENAKLRELVADMWDNYEPIEPDDNVVRDFSGRMTQLGIEVTT